MQGHNLLCLIEEIAILLVPPLHPVCAALATFSPHHHVSMLSAGCGRLLEIPEERELFTPSSSPVPRATVREKACRKAPAGSLNHIPGRWSITPAGFDRQHLSVPL